MSSPRPAPPRPTNKRSQVPEVVSLGVWQTRGVRNGAASFVPEIRRDRLAGLVRRARERGGVTRLAGGALAVRRLPLKP